MCLNRVPAGKGEQCREDLKYVDRFPSVNIARNCCDIGFGKSYGQFPQPRMNGNTIRIGMDEDLPGSLTGTCIPSPASSLDRLVQEPAFKTRMHLDEIADN